MSKNYQQKTKNKFTFLSHLLLVRGKVSSSHKISTTLMGNLALLKSTSTILYSSKIWSLTYDCMYSFTVMIQSEFIFTKKDWRDSQLKLMWKHKKPTWRTTLSISQTMQLTKITKNSYLTKMKQIWTRATNALCHLFIDTWPKKELMLLNSNKKSKTWLSKHYSLANRCFLMFIICLSPTM